MTENEVSPTVTEQSVEISSQLLASLLKEDEKSEPSIHCPVEIDDETLMSLMKPVLPQNETIEGDVMIGMENHQDCVKDTPSESEDKELKKTLNDDNSFQSKAAIKEAVSLEHIIESAELPPRVKSRC